MLLALSGGVDSSVAAALLAEAVGEQLTCVFVDHGLMRKNEGDEVEAAFSPWAMNFVRVDASQLGDLLHIVPVAHPGDPRFRQAPEQRALGVKAGLGLAVFPGAALLGRPFHVKHSFVII